MIERVILLLMAAYSKFENLPVWQHALDIFVSALTEKLKSDFGMKDEIKMAAASISDNIAEGFENNNNKVFFNYLKISKGSSGEVRNQLNLCFRTGLLENNDFEKITEKVISVSNEISNFMDYLTQTPRNRKFD